MPGVKKSHSAVELYSGDLDNRPRFSMGCKRPGKNGKSAPKLTADNIASGFSTFYGEPPPEPRLPRKLIRHQHAQPRPQGRRVLTPVSHDVDPPVGVRIIREPHAHTVERNRGKVYLEPKESHIEMGPCMQAKRRVFNPATGQRRIADQSNSWEFHEIYGRLRRFGAKKEKTYSVGIFPGERNYPPSRDGDGKKIDYALAKFGGSFADRALRTEMIEVPADPEWERRGRIKKGAADRMRDARHLRRLDQTNRMTLSMRRGSASASALPGRVATARQLARPATSSSIQDDVLASLRAQVAELRRRKGVA